MKVVLRREDVIAQEIDQETLVYDPVSGNFHLLNPLAAFVFRHADEPTSVSEILPDARVALGGELQHADIAAAVAELDRVTLLERSDDPPSKGMTRREMVQRLAAAAVLAVPLITTMAAPAAAMAASSPLSPIRPPKHEDKDKDKEERDKKEKEEKERKEREKAEKEKEEKEKEERERKEREKEEKEKDRRRVKGREEQTQTNTKGHS